MRIGTHTGANQLLERLTQHFIQENKDRSIFRKNIGRCILNAAGSDYLPNWELDRTSRMGKVFNMHLVDLTLEKSIERKISAYMQTAFTFCVVEVSNKADRMYWEKKLIGLIAQTSQIEASAAWLGRQSPEAKIASGKLWQVQHIKAEPCSHEELELFKSFLIR